MRTHQIIENSNFVGRSELVNKLQQIANEQAPSVVVIYGRRRVGKTELIEQSYRKHIIVKLEGLENRTQEEQIANILYQLSRYFEQPYIAKLALKSWQEVFDLIADIVKKDKWILYFEELQWLANYSDKFISELKYAWDNRFRHYSGLTIVLCGSSPSFMINKVLHSKSLYGRSINEIHLQEFSLKEVALFFQDRSYWEVLTAYLVIGGIPEYLKRIKKANSILLGVCEQSFQKNAYFSTEYQRIFISSMSDNLCYKNIIELLSKKRFATRKEIAQHLNIQSGGSLTEVINDLVLCGFIEKYTPYQVKNDNSLLTRYCIKDSYLMFYFKFIKPVSNKIAKGIYNNNPISALNMSAFENCLGFAFERMIRKNDFIIAKILGFSGIAYKSGCFLIVKQISLIKDTK